jgi:hypothetical protein
MERYFKRLNTVLLFSLIFFAAFLLLSNSKAQSQESVSLEDLYNDLGLSPDSNITVIDKRFNVDIKTKRGGSNFKLSFVSDGINSSSGSYESLELKGVKPIPIPLNFDISNAYIDAPGTPIYKKIKAPSAAPNAYCDENIKGDCTKALILTNSMATRVWEFIINTKPEANNGGALARSVELKPEDGGIFRWSSIMNSLNSLSSIRLIFDDTGNQADPYRTSLGSGTYWGEDEIQALTPVNGKAFEGIVTEVKNVEVTRAVEYSVQQFAAQLPANITTKVGFSNLSKLADDKGISIIPYYDFNRKDEINTDQLSNILAGLLTLFSGPDTTEQKRIGVHIPLRKVETSDDFGAAYDFCAATKKMNVGSAFQASRIEKDWGDSSFKPECETSTPDITDPTLPAPTPIRDCSRDAVRDDKQTKFDNLSSETRRCIDAVSMYQDKEEAINCANQAIEGGGCDSFTIEEEDLNFSRVEKGDLAVSMGAYLRNAVFTDLNPSFEGPFVNYLSPRFCASFTIEYNISRGEDYIYRWGGGAGNSDQTPKNQYCVVGAVLSNYSWVMHEQNNYYSPTQLAGKINMYKDALTCDKKEIANFGATPMFADNMAPDDKLVYKVQDNVTPGGNPGGHGNLDADSIMIYHGNDPFSLGPILDEINCNGFDAAGNCLPGQMNDPYVSIKTYRDSDIRVIAGANKKPKYVIFTTQKVGGDTRDNKSPRRVMLCRVDYGFNGIKLPPGKGLCKEIERGEKIFLTGKAAMITKDGKDYITYAYYDENDTAFIFGRFIEVDDDNMRDSIVTPGSNQKGMLIHGKQTWEYSVKALDGALYKDKVAVLATKVGGKTTDVQLSLLDPINKKILAQNNLCEGENRSLGYCLLFEDYPVTSKIVFDRESDKLFVVMLGGYAGLVLYPNVDGSIPPAKLFAFNRNNKGVGRTDQAANNADAQKDLEDALKNNPDLSEEEKDTLGLKLNTGSEELSTLDDAQYDARTESLYLFVSSKVSSYMLRVNQAETLGIENKVGLICNGDPTGTVRANNCLVTTQKEFNPATFTWDCSDYFGVGVCGAKKMSPTGYPKVIHSIILPNGKVKVWYTYTELGRSHAIFYSEDFEYSLNGVYERIGNQNSLEYSNVYLPIKRVNAGGKKSLDKVGVVPISNPWALGKLMKGTHLQVVGGFVTEIINSVMKPAKKRCLEILQTRVTNDDPFFKIPGIQQPFFIEEEQPVNNNPSDGSSGGSQFNPSGKYCEETWCVADTTKLYDNPRYRLTTSGGSMTPEEFNTIKTEITKFMNGRYPTKGDYTAKVAYLCDEAQKSGEPCQMLIGTWIQESGGSQNGDAFNCQQPDWNNSASCAVNSMASGGCIYDGNWTGFCAKFKDKWQNQPRIFTGYGSLYTPNKGKPAAQAQGTCEPATRFSLMMNKYTPIDKHINFNNQCNRGLVVREDNNYNVDDSVNKCENDNYAKGAEPDDARFNNGSTPATWPSGNVTGNGTRPNLRFGIEKINEVLPNALKIPVTNACYKGDSSGNPSGGNSTVPSTDIQKDYNVTSPISAVQLDLKQWGKSEAAANILMAYEGLISSPTQRIGGIHEIKPGEFFSFNDTINNPTAQDVERTKPKYKDLGYTFNDNLADNGNGWCEFATGIRLAAAKMNGLSDPFGVGGKTWFTYERFEKPSDVGSFGGFGTGKGTRGDIRNWQHSNGKRGAERGPISLDIYNKIALGAESKLTDNYGYVSIMTNSQSDGWSDGDLELHNVQSDNMYVNVSMSTDKVITIQVFFGSKKTPTPVPSSGAQNNGSFMLSLLNMVVADRKKFIA